MWSTIWDILTYPIDQWIGTSCPAPYYYREDGYTYFCYESDPDRFTAVMAGLLIYGMTLLVLGITAYAAACLYGWLYDRYEFARYAEPCQHEECGHQRTLYVSLGEPSCEEDAPCCGDCGERHERDAVQRQADSEPKHQCMHGHGAMQKHIVIDDLIIDQCAICHSVWLDGKEIDKVRKMSYDEGYSDGRSSAQSTAASTNLALGIAIGSSI